jgi:hypothetical protein
MIGHVADTTSKYKKNKKNYSDRHLHANSNDCCFFIEMISLMKKIRFSSKRTIKTIVPTQRALSVPNNGCERVMWLSVDSIKIKTVKDPKRAV